MLDYDAHALTGSRLKAFGEQYGVDYQFEPSVDELAYGRYGELHLPGMQLTCSDFAITQTYHSCSNHNIAWLICLPLVGQIDVRHGYLHDSDYHTLTAGQSMAVHFTAAAPLHVIHRPQPRLLILTLAVFSPAFFNLVTPSMPQLHIRNLPPTLLQHVRHTLETPAPPEINSLNWQGIALQLLAHALPHNNNLPRIAHDNACKYKRIDILHKRIRNNPCADYQLGALAKDMAMSASNLRQKFRQRYGCSIFEHIRRCRLEQAYADLLCGQSIQQVAYTYGYGYSGNFTQAFKRHFGFTPQQITGTEQGKSVITH